MDIEAIQKSYETSVSPEINKQSTLQAFHVDGIVYLNIYQNFKNQWNIYFVPEELYDVIQYINTGKLLHPHLWVARDPTYKYKWSVMAQEILIKHVRKIIDVKYGGLEKMETNEKQRIRYVRKLRKEQSIEDE